MFWQALLSESERQVRESEERQGRLEQEAKEHRDKVSELEDARRKSEAELKEKYEECKIQVILTFGLFIGRSLFSSESIIIILEIAESLQQTDQQYQC